MKRLLLILTLCFGIVSVLFHAPLPPHDASNNPYGCRTTIYASDSDYHIHWTSLLGLIGLAGLLKHFKEPDFKEQ
jgi:hypothetical protein